MSLSEELLRQTGWKALDAEDVDQLVAEQRQPPDAVPTPFPSWNRACRDEGGGIGLARGWHVVIGAKTGTGKSVIAGNLVRSAIEAGERVGFISLEMSRRQLDTRQLAIISGELIRELETGAGFKEATYRRAWSCVQAIRQATGGQVYRSPKLLRGIADIEGAVTFLRNGPPGCRFYIVDYIQLAGDPNDPALITEVSHRVRQLARDLDVVTVGLSQLNRDTFRRGSRPTIHDLMGGTAIEADADQVLVLDHTRMTRSPAPNRGWDSFLILDKNRHGARVEIPVRFNSANLRFTEILPHEEPSRSA